MAVQRPYLFASYARKDRIAVQYVVDKLRAASINIWMDVEGLAPGESWYMEVEEALQNAAGMIIFLSGDSTQSEFVRRELNYALTRQAPIFPVLLEDPSKIDIPLVLQNIQWLDLSSSYSLEIGAQELATAIKLRIGDRSEALGLREGERKEVIRATVDQVRRKSDFHEDVTPESVFIVHGHDLQFRDEVEKYLLELGVEPVVLSKLDNQHRTLIDKFWAWGEETRFAVVLISADDMGAGRFQYDEPNVGNLALQFRARQNVILELGFFYGFLGWENVFVLFKKSDKVFPNFERPSDLDGVLFEEVDQTGRWKNYLRERLEDAGFQLK